MIELQMFNKPLPPHYCKTDVSRSTFYQGDCLEILQGIESGSVDCIFTSPPYNIGKEYEEMMIVEEYVEWSNVWIKECFRVLKYNGAFILNVGYLSVPNKGRAIPIPYILFPILSNFYLQQEVVWNYGAGVACRNYLSPRNEKILWLVKDNTDYTFNLNEIRDKNVKYPNQKKNGKLRCNPNGKNPSDVWNIPKVTSGKNRASKERQTHPAQTPIELAERCLLGFSNKGDNILDPFMGSGTTGVACKKTGRHFIGIEKDEKYFEIAVSRVSAYCG